MASADAGRSDALLVASLVRGDTTALAELYDRHADAVFRAAFRRLGDRQLAEEVLQDTYVALWNRAELFDPAAGSLLAWLSTIARNRAVDRLRALGRRPAAVPLSAVLPTEEGDDQAVERALASGTLLGAAPPPRDPEQVVEDGALRDQIRGVLDVIPPNERQVLELAYYEELTQTEIADRLGWPLGTVKTRTRRALFRMREALAPILGADVAPPAALAALASDEPREVTGGPR